MGNQTPYNSMKKHEWGCLEIVFTAAVVAVFLGMIMAVILAAASGTPGR